MDLEKIHLGNIIDKIINEAGSVGRRGNEDDTYSNESDIKRNVNTFLAILAKVVHLVNSDNVINSYGSNDVTRLIKGNKFIYVPYIGSKAYKPASKAMKNEFMAFAFQLSEVISMAAEQLGSSVGPHTAGEFRYFRDNAWGNVYIEEEKAALKLSELIKRMIDTAGKAKVKYLDGQDTGSFYISKIFNNIRGLKSFTQNISPIGTNTNDLNKMLAYQHRNKAKGLKQSSDANPAIMATRAERDAYRIKNLI